jgi:hypothetical protein
LQRSIQQTLTQVRRRMKISASITRTATLYIIQAGGDFALLGVRARVGEAALGGVAGAGAAKVLAADL